MSTQESYWTIHPPQLVTSPTWRERLLRTIGRRALRSAIALKERREAAAERMLYGSTAEIPPALRRDLGLPPFTSADVTQYR